MDPNDSPGVHLDDPDDVALLLQDVPWGKVTIGNNVVHIVCPLCSCGVANAQYPEGYTAKQHHIDHHVNMAALFKRLRNQ